jgi:tetratricopeptide (TPR) repeat protein
MADGDIKTLEEQINSLKAEVVLRSESAEKLYNTKNEAMDKRLSSHIKLFNIVYIALAGVIAIITIFLTVFSVNYIKRKANLYAEVAAQEAVKTVFDDYKKDLDERISNMENRIEFSYWYKQGERAFENKDFASAVRYFTDAINKDTNHVYAVGVRGIAYVRLGMMKEAIVDLNKAIEIKEDYAIAYGYKGLAHFYLRDYVAAFNAFHKETYLHIKRNNFENALKNISTVSEYLEKVKVDKKFSESMRKTVEDDIVQLKEQLEKAKAERKGLHNEN